MLTSHGIITKQMKTTHNKGRWDNGKEKKKSRTINGSTGRLTIEDKEPVEEEDLEELMEDFD